VVKKKDMELDEIKYLYLLFYTTIIGGVIFFNSYWKVKKATQFGDLELIKKLSPDRSVFKPILNW
jgi:Ca-activated chloride channel family protein